MRAQHMLLHASGAHAPACRRCMLLHASTAHVPACRRCMPTCMCAHVTTPEPPCQPSTPGQPQRPPPWHSHPHTSMPSYVSSSKFTLLFTVRTGQLRSAHDSACARKSFSRN
eukprot:130992-Chlamydomonas_euryale.AAC.2